MKRSAPFIFLMMLSTMAIAAPATAPSIPDLGIGADMHGAKFFPANDLWNMDISKAPVDPMSDALIKEIGDTKPLHPDFGSGYGIPYIVVDRTQKKLQVKFQKPQDSDRGAYPIPPNAPIEGGGGDGDRHVLVIDRDSGLLYEMWQSVKDAKGDGWSATNGVIFDLRKASSQRRDGTTSADAAGLAIFPGLVRYDEVMIQKKIEHAIRFTVNNTRKSYILPARHQAGKSNDKSLPPMGMRVRLKADFDISKFPEPDQVILTALKKYGMIIADNGSDWYISGAPDDRWNDGDIGQLRDVKGSDFEVIRMGR